MVTRHHDDEGGRDHSRCDEKEWRDGKSRDDDWRDARRRDDGRWMSAWYGWPWSPWSGWYGDAGAFLAQRIARRTARYYGDVADLTGRGSVEPRIWIGRMQSYWSGLAGDYGDYLKVASGWKTAADLVEVDETDPKVIRIDLVHGQKTEPTRFEIPDRLFDDGVDRVRLFTTGLSSGERRVLHPDRHLRFEPEVVRKDDDHHSMLCLHDLPDDLYPRMRLTGLVTAQRRLKKNADGSQPKDPPRVLVATVEVQIV